MSRIAQIGPYVIPMEIYHGLVYGKRAFHSRCSPTQAFVLNGFSKAFAMTGWRLGSTSFRPAGFRSASPEYPQNFSFAGSVSQWRGWLPSGMQPPT